MWDWFTGNCVWYFFAAAVLTAVLYLIKQRLQESIKKSARRSQPQRAGKAFNTVFWVAESVLLLIMTAALVAFVLVDEGVCGLITPETIQAWLIGHGTRLLVILVIGIWLWFASAKFMPPLIRRSIGRPVKGESKRGMEKRADTLTTIFTGIGKGIIIILVFLFVLGEFDISIAPVLTGLGIVGIAVGLGAQYLIKDLIAGIFILLENQYRVGDVARIADTAGLVEEITLRKTVLRDLDGIVHHVPNGEIRIASNFTRHFARVNLNVSVAYGTDLDQAIKVINRVGQELAADENWKERVITPPQVLRVDKLGDSGIEIKIMGDVKPIEQWAIMGELRLRIKKAFDAEGIEIPWPHTKVYFGNSPQP